MITMTITQQTVTMDGHLEVRVLGTEPGWTELGEDSQFRRNRPAYESGGGRINTCSHR
jgi:hypothetical protein